MLLAQVPAHDHRKVFVANENSLANAATNQAVAWSNARVADHHILVAIGGGISVRIDANDADAQHG